jgi:parvulin-like peptidyl-prolyl isomerase
MMNLDTVWGRGVLRLSLVALALVSSLAAVACARNDAGHDDPVVARVDGHDVRQDDVRQVLAEARLLREEADEAGALDQAVRRELVRQEAARLGVKADEGALADRETGVVDELGGESALDQALKDAGMTRGQLREGLEADLLAETLAEAKYPGVEATSSQARAFYRRHRDDLFTTPAAVDLGAINVRNRGIAGNALKRLRAGRPFSEVARQFNIDLELKDNEGRFGWIAPSSLPGPLRKGVERLGPGEVSPPLAFGGGVWIFKLFAFRPADVRSFDAVRGDVVRLLTARRQIRELEAWLDAQAAGPRVEKL